MSFRSLASGAAVAALMAASPAAAADYLFDQVNDSFTVNFNGFVGDSSSVISGLTSELFIKLTGGLGTNTLNFSYELRNTSTSGGSDSRVSGFAFNSNPDVAAATGSGLPGGEFTNINLNGNYPNGINNVEVCLTSNNGASCAGGANGGALLGDPANGTFSLVFGGNKSAVTLSDFYVRYQSLDTREGSASGEEVGAVPEPATWAMLLIGFAAIGGTLRSRKSLNGRRLRVA